VRNEVIRNLVSLRTDLASDLPPALGDRVQLQQVLINLVMNGIEAMRTVIDRPRELLIKSATYTGGVLVQVQDSGTGFNPEHTDRIFEPFFTTKAEGIGMGLSISHSIVDSHGGRLWAESDSNGVLFQFILPMNASPERPLLQAPGHAPAGGAQLPAPIRAWKRRQAPIESPKERKPQHRNRGFFHFHFHFHFHFS
jgi:signal transduction histidine kinase